MNPSKRQREILARLNSDKGRWRESQLETSNHFIRQMYLAGWVDGAGYDDDRGTGNYPSTRIWWITAAGRAALTVAQREET